VMELAVRTDRGNFDRGIRVATRIDSVPSTSNYNHKNREARPSTPALFTVYGSARFVQASSEFKHAARMVGAT
jgi:hypothetical protein